MQKKVSDAIMSVDFVLEKGMKKIVACVLVALCVFMVCACSQKEYDGTIGFGKGNAKIIAHRGLSGLEVENTDSAFIEAGKRSYYGIESDVRKTSDGKFIMCHDETLSRISGKDIVVENTTLDELLKVELFAKKEGKSVEKLSTLESYIAICKEYDKQAILELKSNFTEQEIANMIGVISSCGYIDRVTFISFNYDNLLYVRNVLPTQKAMYLFSELSDEITANLIRDGIDVAINHKALTKKAVERFHSAGLEVNCWTVDSVSTAEKLVSWGVDYVTTNILE